MGSNVEEGQYMEEYLEEQREAYGGSEYNIDWEEVREGRSSGMPGKWVKCRTLYYLFCGILPPCTGANAISDLLILSFMPKVPSEYFSCSNLLAA